MHSLITQSTSEAKQQEDVVNATCQGLELLLARVRRLMQHCKIERVDVLRQAFDAEIMRAVDVIEAPNISNAHVAEQYVRAYLWQGKVLCYADVRLAK